MRLTDVHAATGVDPGELLAWAAAVEAGSEHPVGRAVVAGAGTRASTLPAASAFESVAGPRAFEAALTAGPLWVGSRKLMADAGLAPLRTAGNFRYRFEASGRTASWSAGTAPPEACWPWPTHCGPTLPTLWPNCTPWASRWP